MKKDLEERKSKGAIKSYAALGLKPGSNNEIFLLALLYGMAEKTRWNTEADIVTAIDWPATDGAPAPQGRVTVRIDSQGVASAELIAAGPVPAAAQTTFATGSAKLIADFGFASVTGWSGQKPAEKQKDAAEISDVLAALELLRKSAAQNISALKGVELIRVPSLTNIKNEGGEFFRGEHAALGAKADVKPYLKLADLAFAGDDVQFFGGGKDDQGKNTPTVPSSFQTILHEVGHAVEAEQLRLTEEGLVGARSDVAAAKKISAGHAATIDAELKEAQRKGKRAVDAFWKKQGDTHKKDEAAEQEVTDRELATTKKLNSTTDPVSGHTTRLQKFIDLVEGNKIRKFTQYSAESPKEFYAEAYSLWLVDPAFLSTNYKVVYNFFQSGDYLR